MPATEHSTISAAGALYPLRIITEHRTNCRVTIRQSGIIIRVASAMPKNERLKTIEQLKLWAVTRIEANPADYAHLLPGTTTDGDTLTIMGTSLAINITTHCAQNAVAEMDNTTIAIAIPESLAPPERKKVVTTLISKLLARRFKPVIERRIYELNELHFQRKINRVKMRHATSRWGSCSSDGTIMVSTRILLAPSAVIDYLLVHELAHLVHPNHSPQYWALVASIIPEYKSHIMWLQQNASKCIF